MGEWCVVPLDPRVYPAVLCRTQNSNKHTIGDLKHDMFHSMSYFIKIDTNKTMKTLGYSLKPIIEAPLIVLPIECLVEQANI